MVVYIVVLTNAKTDRYVGIDSVHCNNVAALLRAIEIQNSATHLSPSVETHRYDSDVLDTSDNWGK